MGAARCSLGQERRQAADALRQQEGASTHPASPDWLCATIVQCDQALGHLDVLVTRVGAAVEEAQQEGQGPTVPAPANGSPASAAAARPASDYRPSWQPLPASSAGRSCRCNYRPRWLQRRRWRSGAAPTWAALTALAPARRASRAGAAAAATWCAAWSARPAAAPTGRSIDASAGGCSDGRQKGVDAGFANAMQK